VVFCGNSAVPTAVGGGDHRTGRADGGHGGCRRSRVYTAEEAIRQGKKANQTTLETCACRATARAEVTIVSIA
jgi:hypothetical protein